VPSEFGLANPFGDKKLVLALLRGGARVGGGWLQMQNGTHPPPSCVSWLRQ